MHFFYLDESGDTGRDLDNQEQPIMVLGGISLRDEGWNKTTEEFHTIVHNYFHGSVPQDFELHAYELLSLDGRGPFEGHPMGDRLHLACDVLDLILTRKHGVHFIGIDKQAVKNSRCGVSLPFNPMCPYLLAFDYMITYINWLVKQKLGRSARALVILDEKRQFHDTIERITRDRRFDAPLAHRIKWITEISYPVDSRKNVMVQVSDLVVFCIRRFLEIEHSHRPGWPQRAKDFYAQRYDKLMSRVAKKSVVERQGRDMDRLNKYIAAVTCNPIGLWRSRYSLG